MMQNTITIISIVVLRRKSESSMASFTESVPVCISFILEITLSINETDMINRTMIKKYTILKY